MAVAFALQQVQRYSEGKNAVKAAVPRTSRADAKLGTTKLPPFIHWWIDILLVVLTCPQDRYQFLS